MNWPIFKVIINREFQQFIVLKIGKRLRIAWNVNKNRV